MTGRSAQGRAALLATAVLLGFAAPRASAYEVVAVRDGGTLLGTVRFVGTPPKLAPLPLGKHRGICGERGASEALVLSADRGVEGSVIMIEGVGRGKAATGDVILDNRRCRFVPHVTAVAPGIRIRVKNSDPVLHRTHGFLGRLSVFNLALPDKNQMIDITKRLQKPGVIRVLCDAHPYMSAWIVVHDSPYVAVTDARGAFRIDAVPPGSYAVVMWHAGFRSRGVDRPRTVTRHVTVVPGGTTTADFELR